MSFMFFSNETNSWGAPKGYEMMFEGTVSSQVFPPGHPLIDGTSRMGSK